MFKLKILVSLLNTHILSSHSEYWLAQDLCHLQKEEHLDHMLEQKQDCSFSLKLLKLSLLTTMAHQLLNAFWQFLDSLDDQDDYECEPSSYSENLDLRTYFGMLLEIGANFNPSNAWGLDFGIQYNIIPTFRPEYEYEEQEYGDNGDLSIAINKLSKAINADYLTFYFGFNFNFSGGK